VVLIGLMGAGKTKIGQRLGKRLGLPFVDADDEIAAAAGCTIPEIFETLGEPAFREGEWRVIARLLDGPPQVLATGGGAFMDPQTRQRVANRGISIWLRAELDVLVERTGRRGGRPLLAGTDRRQTLARLMAERYPVYGLADAIVDTGFEPPEATVDKVVQSLRRFAHNHTVDGDRPGVTQSS